MKAARIIEDVSRDLNDQEPGYEYTRWTQAQLASYLREALLDAAPYVKVKSRVNLDVDVD